ncbi:MAG: hemerythrin domain-containing protein [Hydrogenophaga sp.]|nr:hemerythrin domain-containing protein [Hydrogenophaga sp.]
MLDACHERVQRMLRLLARLQERLQTSGWDPHVASAAQDVMRYFDEAAPRHHEDEERHVFPPLLSGKDEALCETVQRLRQDHRDMEAAWSQAREVLAALRQAPPVGWTGLDPLAQAALDGFSSLYARHLEDEDGLVYPAAQALLNPRDLQAMSADMMRRRGLTPS